MRGPSGAKASAPPRSSLATRAVSACSATSGLSSRSPRASACENFAALRWAQRTRCHRISSSLAAAASGLDSGAEPEPSAAAVGPASILAATKSKTMSSLATRTSSASRISAKTLAGSCSNAVRISESARKGWKFRTIRSTAQSRICLKAAPSSVPGMWNRQYCSSSSGAVAEKAASIRLPMASKSPPMPRMSAILSSRSALEAGTSNPAWFSE
mmetsp:Transcript_108616/g.307039  ORF Transcript_108616/g.307039 Transcript_108616/m.307039 type:complete len:214 (+) Transcript_108616:620-1261(+)